MDIKIPPKTAGSGSGRMVTKEKIPVAEVALGETVVEAE